MKSILSNAKTAIILLIVTLLSIGFYTYMLVRPISYGMNYHIEMEYDSETFEGDVKYRRNGTLLNKNSNFDEETEEHYYYRDGYIFTLVAETETKREAEIAYINNNFDTLITTSISAFKTSAFKQTPAFDDSGVATYTCKGAVVFAIAGGVVELALVTLTVFSFILYKTSKKED